MKMEEPELVKYQGYGMGRTDGFLAGKFAGAS
jgi:hypothetical protein